MIRALVFDFDGLISRAWVLGHLQRLGLHDLYLAAVEALPSPAQTRLGSVLARLAHRAQ